jgi:hypothetical protein
VRCSTSFGSEARSGPVLTSYSAVPESAYEMHLLHSLSCTSSSTMPKWAYAAHPIGCIPRVRNTLVVLTLVHNTHSAGGYRWIGTYSRLGTLCAVHNCSHIEVTDQGLAREGVVRDRNFEAAQFEMDSQPLA